MAPVPSLQIPVLTDSNEASPLSVLSPHLPWVPPPKSPVSPELLRLKNPEKAVIAVVGVGYVGESLVNAFATSGYSSVIGFDISVNRIKELNELYHEFSNTTLTTNAELLEQADIACICVPTLVNKESGNIDLSYVEQAVKTVGKSCKIGTVVVLESTVGVGHSRRLLASLEELGMFCGFSPERVDPGRVEPESKAIPKVISGLCEEALEAIKHYYGFVFENLVPVTTVETAEMVKLYENCFRMINIAYINEVSDACSTKNINVWEVVSAASTKPFGYMPFYPSLGVGGHCIPVNPYYLFASGLQMPILKLCTEIQEIRPATFASNLLKTLTKPVNRILVVGLAFKPGQSVLSHSPGIDFARALKRLNQNIQGYDPLVNATQIPWLKLLSVSEWNVENLNSFDCIVVAMKQEEVDFSLLQAVNCKIEQYCKID